MKGLIERVLVVEAQDEVASYTCALLDDLGARHILRASDFEQATTLFENAREKQRPFKLIVCDTSQGAHFRDFLGLIEQTPLLIISHAGSEHNVRMAARVGLERMIFKPFGKEQLSQVLKNIPGLL